MDRLKRQCLRVTRLFRSGVVHTAAVSMVWVRHYSFLQRVVA